MTRKGCVAPDLFIPDKMAGGIRKCFPPASVKANKITNSQTTCTDQTQPTKPYRLISQERAKVKCVVLDKKSTMPKALPPLDDPDLPPPPDILSAKQAATAVVVTWDMQISSDSFGGTVDTIGAHCPLEKVDKGGMYVSRVAVQGLRTQQPGDSSNGEEDYALWAQDEKQSLESFVKWLANISYSKSEPNGSRNVNTGDNRTQNVVLLSFGGISTRIPKLFLALRRHKLVTQFENVVIGICDVNAMALSGDSSASIGTISRNVLGVDKPETDDPAVQSRHLYRIIAKLFGNRKFISAHLHPLARNTFTPSYVMKLSTWRFKTDHRANDLRAIVTTRIGKGVNRKRSLIKNLLAVGYDYGTLRKQYHALGECIFREVLLNKLRHMKRYRESNLTETKYVGCKTVIESVVNHFKEIHRERLLKRVPHLD